MDMDVILRSTKVFAFASLFVVGFAAVASDQVSPCTIPEIELIQSSNRFRSDWAEPFGAEELYDGDDAPRIPEPMVFDLVRPLGAQRGEAEINTLAIIPLNRRLGVAEWAPEVEVAIAEGVAIEFELPFEEWSLKAYKTAAQVTFGRGFNDSFIHGAQGILLYDRETSRWSPTLLYLAGFQFDENWSALAMAGLRTEFEGDDRGNRTEKLFNFSLFRHVGDYTTLGVETNSAASLVGNSEFRLIPQVHQELQDHIMIQFGAGCLFTREATVPEAAMRLIYSF
jgi:hypothetical protein